jgi:chemotaxis protein CheZ
MAKTKPNGKSTLAHKPVKAIRVGKAVKSTLAARAATSNLADKAAKSTPVEMAVKPTLAVNSSDSSLAHRYGSRVLSLSAALEANDEEAFMAELNSMVRERDDVLWTQLRKLTSDLHGALERFQLDSRLVDLAEKEVPDAKQRLDHVLKMTDEAAHKTMDLVDQSGPLAGRIAKEAAELGVLWQQFNSRTIDPQDFRNLLPRMTEFLASAQRDTETVRANLAEVLMTQGYQDLTGQIIRGVIKLVTEVEQTLGDLVKMATLETVKKDTSDGDQYRETRGHGPTVPGVNHGVVVGDQTDVDALLFNLGM